MADIENCFFLKPQHKRYNDEDDEEAEVDEKSKTTNISDLLHNIKKQPQKVFEKTHDISKIYKKASFFSHSKSGSLYSTKDNLDDEEGNEEDLDDDQEEVMPYDERDHH